MVCIRNVVKQLLPKCNSSHIYWFVWSVEMDKKLKKKKSGMLLCEKWCIFHIAQKKGKQKQSNYS